MVATLILGLIGLLGEVPAPSQEPEAIQAPRPPALANQPFEVPLLTWPPLAKRPSGPLFRLPEGAKPNPLRDAVTRATQGPEPSAGIVCTVRAVRADPRIDPGIVRPAERDIDPKMSVPSVCAK